MGRGDTRRGGFVDSQVEQDLVDVVPGPVRQVSAEMAALEVEHLGSNPSVFLVPRGLEPFYQVVTGGVEASSSLGPTFMPGA